MVWVGVGVWDKEEFFWGEVREAWGRDKEMRFWRDRLRIVMMGGDLLNYVCLFVCLFVRLFV